MPDFGEVVLTFGPSASPATVAALGDPIEAPFDADVSNITMTAGGAPAGSAAVGDFKVAGVSVFAAQLGEVGEVADAQTGGSGGMAIGDLSFYFDPNDGQNDLIVGQTLLIGTENLVVTSVAGSSEVDEGGAAGLMKIGVTRAANGTAAAAHAAGAAVLPAPPSIAAGATSSATEDQPSEGVVANLPPISKGQLLSAALTAVGSGSAGNAVQMEVTLTER
jgi:hypothetical protein